MTTSVKIGNRRLLKLADSLAKADTVHKRKGEPTYYQGHFAHDCGTPACALGHWAAANTRRWITDVSCGVPGIRNGSIGFEAAKQDFALNDAEVIELFEASGCGNAKTAKQAARYIRRFVKSREKEAAR